MKILLADDDIITLQILETTLRRLNYEVLLAHDGNEAWSLLQSTHPDIALLDWIMPGLDGLEICRRLQARAHEHFIYVILLTANDRTENITAGLDAGANDYITKPFDLHELKSRVAVGARVSEYEKQLQTMNAELRRYSAEMEQLAQERAKQLVQADRLVSLGAMSAGIAHEINNPLTILQGNVKLFRGFWTRELLPLLTQAPERFQALNAKAGTDLMAALENSVQRIRHIVDGMRKFSHGEGGQVGVLDIAACVQDALAICLPKTKARVAIEQELAPVPVAVKGDPVQITQVLVNLIGNAADALAGTPSATVVISLTAAAESIQLRVRDNGPGIPKENLDKLWSPFYTTKPIGEGTGLGLFICRTIVEEHGGRIWAESEPGAGATFVVELPSSAEYDRLHPAKDNPEE
jgi:two-component system, NtrC family, sensor kinase